MNQSGQQLVKRAIVKNLEFPLPMQGSNGERQLVFSLWEVSPDTLEAVRSHLADTFPSGTYEFSVFGHCTFRVIFRRVDRQHIADAVERFLNWLVTPVPV